MPLESWFPFHHAAVRKLNVVHDVVHADMHADTYTGAV